MTDELLTAADCRRILGVGANAMTRYLREIRHLRLGNPRTGPVRVRRSDLEAWMERRTVAPSEEEHGQEARLGNGLPAPVENVMGAPMRQDLMLCGTMFGLDIRKHRQFESNVALPLPPRPCGDHAQCYNPWQGEGRSAAKLRAAMGIDWLPISGGASRKAGYTGDLFNAIPPAYTEWIGRSLMALVRMEAAA